MITILSALVSLLSFRFRSRASLELELVALQHQVTVLRRLNFVALAQTRPFRREESFCSATVSLEFMTPTTHVYGWAVANVLFGE
jgi:hypothetical protein